MTSGGTIFQVCIVLLLEQFTGFRPQSKRTRYYCQVAMQRS